MFIPAYQETSPKQLRLFLFSSNQKGLFLNFDYEDREKLVEDLGEVLTNPVICRSNFKERYLKEDNWISLFKDKSASQRIELFKHYILNIPNFEFKDLEKELELKEELSPEEILKINLELRGLREDFINNFIILLNYITDVNIK